MGKKRLFLRSDGVTDGVWWYCGGPDPFDAARGVANLLQSAIETAFSNNDDDDVLADLEFDVREMTDEEVENLGDG